MYEAEIEKVLRGHGISDRPDLFDSNIHSWRCTEPDRGTCECLDELVHDLARVLDGRRPA